MKKNSVFRTITAMTAALGLILATSCTTTSYDAYGRPVETIDPVKTTLAVAAVGAVGYALAKNHDSRRSHRNHYRNDHYRHHGYSHGYGHSGYGHHSGYGRYCR